MKHKYIITLLLVVSIFLSINVISASEVSLTNVSSDILDSESIVDDTIIDSQDAVNIESNQNDVLSLENENVNLSSGSEYDVKTTDGTVGDNSDDPIIKIVETINEDEVESATINIFNGTYVMPPGQWCQFEILNNLVVNGVGGEVIFEPMFPNADLQRGFCFASPAEVTFNNIIFDSSKLTNSKYGDRFAFSGAEEPISVTYNNCTFIGSAQAQALDSCFVSSTFVSCTFKNHNYLFSRMSESPEFTHLKNCILLNVSRISSTINKHDSDVLFDGVWLGQNTLPTYTVESPNEYASGTWDIFTYGPINNLDTTYTLPVKYAIFSVSVNHLKNNQYEIVGKLTWNGTDSSEGMENFPPMTVTLTSTTGSIQEATLINGFFKTNYTISSSEHKVTAKLDSEEINLTFINIGLDAPIIGLGNNKNITVTFPQVVSGTVILTVDGNNYPITVDDNSIAVPITEELTIGTHDVNVTFIDETNHIYGFNTTTITILEVKETTLTTANVSTTYNVAKDLVITLTSDGEALVNKTINVVVGTIDVNKTTNDSGQVSVNIATLTPGSYEANIAFAGDEVYVKSNATAKVVVNKVASAISASAVSATYNVAKNLVITLTANGKALNGQKVTVKVGTISKTLTTDAKGQVSVDVSKLTPKTYTATFTYAGDSINAGLTNTVKVVVNKAKPKITAKKSTFKAKKKTKKYTVVLKDNKGKAIKKAKLTLKVKGKTYKATTNAKGKATFKITKLTKKGKNTATIKFGGNMYFKSINKKVNIVVKK